MMKFIQPRWIFTLAVFFLHLACQESAAQLPNPEDDSDNTIYDTLLQREYAGPVIFPNHQVERKAQRSPSLRLRFGRRSDPEFISMAEKRWFGDVNQKPIRSPSLRLRFGRRSDPSIPLHSNFDILMNTDLQENSIESYPDDDVFERIIRKPQRLRWGRSINYESEPENTADEENNREEELLNAEKLHQLSMTIRQLFENMREYKKENEQDNQFLRETRKQAPLRLRWGRSTGGRNSILAEDKKINANKHVEVPNKA